MDAELDSVSAHVSSAHSIHLMLQLHASSSAHTHMYVCEKWISNIDYMCTCVAAYRACV